MNRKIAIVLLLFIPFWGFSQTNETALPEKEKKIMRKKRPTYLEVSAGINSSNFRDFATSPLFYKGVPKYIGIERMKMDSLRESEIGLTYSFGNYSVTVGDITTQSKVNTVSTYYSKLHCLPKFCNDDWNVKVGGLFHTTGNLRINAALQNNAGGIELFATLFGSVKVTRDVSRTKVKNKRFIFIKYRLNPRKRDLAFRLNLGLMNNTYRNGFVYSGQSGVLNKTKIFDDYQFKVFSGYRMSSSLDYTFYLKNKNAVQLSYIWDAYKTGGDLDKFEMANHILKVSLLFNTK